MSVCVKCPKPKCGKVVVNRSNCWPPMCYQPCVPSCAYPSCAVKCVSCPTTTLMQCKTIQGGLLCTSIVSVPCAPPTCCPVTPVYCYPSCYNC